MLWNNGSKAVARIWYEAWFKRTINNDNHFIYWPEKLNLAEDVEVFYPVNLRSVQRFQRRRRKCLKQSEARMAICLYRWAQKHKHGRWQHGIDILLPVKFRWILLSGYRVKVENVSANQRPGWLCCFSDRPYKHKLRTGRGHGHLASCHGSFNSVRWFQRRSWKCLSH